MDELKFEWDKKKAASNVKKHGVSFDEARSVFYDEKLFNSMVLIDHSEDEDRFILLGASYKLKTLVVVCHCFRE